MKEENHDQLVSFIWNIANDGHPKVVRGKAEFETEEVIEELLPI